MKDKEIHALVFAGLFIDRNKDLTVNQLWLFYKGIDFKHKLTEGAFRDVCKSWRKNNKGEQHGCKDKQQRAGKK